MQLFCLYKSLPSRVHHFLLHPVVPQLSSHQSLILHFPEYLLKSKIEKNGILLLINIIIAPFFDIAYCHLALYVRLYCEASGEIGNYKIFYSKLFENKCLVRYKKLVV